MADEHRTWRRQDEALSFLTPITAQSLEMLSSLMDERKVEAVELF